MFEFDRVHSDAILRILQINDTTVWTTSTDGTIGIWEVKKPPSSNHEDVISPLSFKSSYQLVLNENMTLSHQVSNDRRRSRRNTAHRSISKRMSKLLKNDMRNKK